MSDNREKFENWLIEKSENLNSNHWEKLLDAEQDLAQTNDKKRKRTMQNIALRARNDIKKYKTQLNKLSTPAANVKSKTVEYLNNWDKSFYFMAKFADSQDIQDFGASTKYYKMLDSSLQEILGSLGKGSNPQTQTLPQSTPPFVVGHQIIREKEIIREKQVTIKVRCRYCKGAYNEELDCCPHCGGTR